MKCHETLEDPIILPCGKTICYKHLLNEANNFKCNLCDNFHDKTVEKFPVNEMANRLVQICDNYVDLNSIDLGKEFKLAKDQCKHLKDLMNESDLLVKELSFYIDNYFTKLRNEIDLYKEQLIEDIRDKHEQLIDKIKEIETKLKQNAQNKNISNKFKQIIKANKEKLTEWTEKLDSKLNLDNCCADISNKSKQSISELKNELNEYQQDLLDNKLYKFKSILFKDSVFGDLVIIDEKHLRSDYSVSLIQTLYGHKFRVCALAVLKNGNLVSGSYDSTIKIWNPTTGASIQTIKISHMGIAPKFTVLHNDNIALYSDSYDGIIEIWNPTTGELIQTLNTLGVCALTVLKNGNFVTCSDDNTIKIWG